MAKPLTTDPEAQENRSGNSSSKTGDTKENTPEVAPEGDPEKTDEPGKDEPKPSPEGDPEKTDEPGKDDQKPTPSTDIDSNTDEQTEKQNASKRRKILFAVIGGLSFLLVVSIGVAWWYFLGEDEGKSDKVISDNNVLVEIRMPPPKGTKSLNVIAQSDEAVTESAEPNNKNTANAESPINLENKVTEAGEESEEPTSLNAIVSEQKAQVKSLENIGEAADPLAGLTIPAFLSNAFVSIPDNKRSLSKKEALPDAPVSALLEEKEGVKGSLPKIAEDGSEAWKTYARTHDSKNRPILGVLLANAGLNTTMTLAAIQKTPPEVTIVLSPYGKDLNNWSVTARQAGHEVFLSMPMESNLFPKEDPGPLALTSKLTPEETSSTLERLLASFTGYVGTVTHMGSQFNQEVEKLEPILATLKSKGLAFIDASQSQSKMAEVALKVELTFSPVDVLIDPLMGKQKIIENLNKLEELAVQNGSALGLAYPVPITLSVLSSWLDSLRKKGISLAPASHIIKSRMGK